MAKRRRRRGDSRDAQREAIDLTIGSFRRDGRFMTFQGSGDAQAIEDAANEFLAQVPEVESKRAERHARLLEIMGLVGPMEVVAFASLVYLRMDPNTFKEWESDRLTSHIEYLALQALAVEPGMTPADLHPTEVSDLVAESIQIVRELFEDQVTLITAAQIRQRHAPDRLNDYALRAQLESMSVRGSAYHEHHVRVLTGCLEPYDTECMQLLGFTVRDALALPQALHEIVDSTRLAPRAQKASEWRDLMLRVLRKARERTDEYPIVPPGLLTGSIAQAKQAIERYAWLFVYHQAESLVTITAEQLTEHTGIPVDRCQAVLDAFACPPAEYNAAVHTFPVGAHPITARPLLRTADGYLLPVPSSFVESIRARMEDLLQPHRNVWQRYLRHRAQWVEAEACRVIAGALRGSTHWTNLKWKAGDAKGELDGLVACDDFAFRVQAKAGRISSPARRGAPDRMRKHVGELIQFAAEQHSALADALTTSSGTDLGFNAEQVTALEAPIQVEVIVCLDEVTIWSTETHELTEIGMISADRQVPWVLSLTDLMATVDILRDGPFLHYVGRRQRLEVDGRISAHDELDWLGHYVEDGLYFDPYFEGDDAPDEFRLLSYTEPIDSWYFAREGVRTVETPKPALPLPPGLVRVVERLSDEQPRHWTIAAMCLLDGSTDSWAVWEQAIRKVAGRLAEVGWTNASLAFFKRYGITLFLDYRVLTPVTLLENLQSYCSRKLAEVDVTTWVGIGEAMTGGLVVQVLHEPPPTLRDIFMTPGAAWKPPPTASTETPKDA